ncbi:MAG: hypothetical protein DYH12_23835, partial [Sorangiineae bacterium PRO1]|nr:hypothetical protein [Sorangiineae bacterium PRO1]
MRLEIARGVEAVWPFSDATATVLLFLRVRAVSATWGLLLLTVACGVEETGGAVASGGAGGTAGASGSGATGGVPSVGGFPGTGGS